MELCFNHPVVCCSPSLPYYSDLVPLPVLCLYIGTRPVQQRRQPFIYVGEEVCIGWRRTGACYTDKLTFSHGSSNKVWGAHYTNMRIIFKFLR